MYKQQAKDPTKPFNLGLNGEREIAHYKKRKSTPNIVVMTVTVSIRNIPAGEALVIMSKCIGGRMSTVIGL